MSHKILVADDSQTIQKVIKITLANEDYDIVECLSANELPTLIKEHQPVLVLLDFGLSEQKSGFDLAQEIKQLGVDKIFMLYGTFDSIDESKLKSIGVQAHIIKPFEGTKFIQTCRSLVQDMEDDNLAEQSDFSSVEQFPEPIEESHDQDDEQWVVNQPEVEDSHEPFEIENKLSQTNELQSEVSDWGFDLDIPGVIGEDNKSEDTLAKDFPPIIVEDTKENTEEEPEEQLPHNNDLEYPDVDMIKSTVEAEIIEKPKSQLISVAELADVNTDEKEMKATQNEGTRTEEEIRALEEQIADELDEDIWSADEVVESDSDDIVDMSAIQPEEEAQPKVESPSEQSEDTDTNIDITALNTSDIEAQLTPIIERIIEKKMNEVIENVAWEVIPDLAENLIKKELEKIAKEIISKPNN